jgi:hypothetical protein
MKWWMTCTISMIQPWHTRDIIVGNILLRGFETNIILICYVSLSSQDCDVPALKRTVSPNQDYYRVSLPK